MNSPLTVWIGAFITLAVLSCLIKDNIFYRLAQKAAMGIGVGIGVVLFWREVLHPYWWAHIQAAFNRTEHWSNALWLLVLVPGMMWYCQMSRKWFWLSTPVIGLFVGVAAGIAFKGQILLMLPQLASTLKPLNPWMLDGGPTRANIEFCLNNLFFLVALFTTLLYFCFTIKADNRAFRVPMKTGRLVIMVALGAMFGNTVMTRMSFLIERIEFLSERLKTLIHLVTGG